ncbi:hypothetical protein BDY21DRAFT_366311 [Lineolata rhizophorae]|uniref:Putative zinc-finger domain-containing protein n=1 Tax=Lineolata rhizophorae TaxID=578093 RepID=A0A6A6NRJ3_9PEZI|nr:hypothetical protein BDY21DRAFT_366311 [Lineolata rhizophorae]
MTSQYAYPAYSQEAAESDRRAFQRPPPPPAQPFPGLTTVGWPPPPPAPHLLHPSHAPDPAAAAAFYRLGGRAPASAEAASAPAAWAQPYHPPPLLPYHQLHDSHRLHAAPPSSASVARPHVSPAKHSRVAELVDSEREEGELSEASENPSPPRADASPSVNSLPKSGPHFASGTSASARGDAAAVASTSSPQTEARNMIVGKHGPKQIGNSSTAVFRRQSDRPDNMSSFQKNRRVTEAPSQSADWPSTIANQQPGPALTNLNPHEVLRKKENAKRFIKALHEHGWGFRQLARLEDFSEMDESYLRQLYRELSLPLPGAESAGKSLAESSRPASVTACKVAQATSTGLPARSTPSAPPTRSSIAPKVPSAANGPVSNDRAEYLKRLAAAKTGKPQLAMQAKASNVSPAPEAQAMSHEEKKKAKTELARAKMKELAAKKAAGQGKGAAGAQSADVPMRSASESSSSLFDPPSQAATPLAQTQQRATVDDDSRSTSASVEEPSKASFHPSPRQEASAPPSAGNAAIPGLTMASPEAQIQVQGPSMKPLATPPAPPVSARKRPVAADFDFSSPKAKHRRPFGQARDSPEESMIIEVSSDDDEDGDGDIVMEDGCMGHGVTSAGSTPSTPLKLQNTMKLPSGSRLSEVPSRPQLARSQTGNSTPHTPLAPDGYGAKAGNNGGIDAQLSAKDREIEALRRAIALKEKIRKEKASRTQTPTAGAMAAPPPSLPAQQQQMSVSERQETPATAFAAQTLVSIAPTPPNLAPSLSVSGGVAQPSGASTPNTEDLGWKRKKREETQSGIFALDAKLTARNSKLEQLKREMAELEAENLREMEDKKKLEQELESLGVDTEGMAHADMKAVREELRIQQEEQEQEEQAQQEASIVQNASTMPSTKEGEVIPPDPVEKINGASDAADTLVAEINKPVEESEDAGNTTANDALMDTDVSMSDAKDSEEESTTNQAPVVEEGDTETKIQREFGILSLDESPIDYEPEEPKFPNVDAVANAIQAASPAESSDGSDSDSSDSDEASSDDSSDDSAQTNASADKQAGHERDMPIADDLVPELQSSQPTYSQSSDVRSAVNQIPFTPYESPLAIFKAYRYHPEFANEVTGGFRSLTYSTKIDPMKTLCIFETMGGACNDPHCKSQHFRDMLLSEPAEMLQAQIGPENPGRTDEERRQYTAGLMQIINALSINDPNILELVGSTIVKYRRDFLKDPSRVLNI